MKGLGFINVPHAPAHWACILRARPGSRILPTHPPRFYDVSPERTLREVWQRLLSYDKNSLREVLLGWKWSLAGKALYEKRALTTKAPSGSAL